MEIYSIRIMDDDKDIPDSIPMYIMRAHELQAQKNHGQTLKELAQRGGLSAKETYLILKDLDLGCWKKLKDKDVKFFLRKVVGL